MSGSVDCLAVEVVFFWNEIYCLFLGIVSFIWGKKLAIGSCGVLVVVV